MMTLIFLAAVSLFFFEWTVMCRTHKEVGIAPSELSGFYSWSSKDSIIYFDLSQIQRTHKRRGYTERSTPTRSKVASGIRMQSLQDIYDPSSWRILVSLLSIGLQQGARCGKDVVCSGCQGGIPTLSYRSISIRVMKNASLSLSNAFRHKSLSSSLEQTPPCLTSHARGPSLRLKGVLTSPWWSPSSSHSWASRAP